MEKKEQLEQAIQILENQRGILGDAAVDTSIAALKAQLEELERDKTEKLQRTAERKLVTVMFADISGFTALSENLDPEDVRVLMNACFNQLVPVITKYEGVVDKFIGDEIMALFGAPQAHEKHAELACSAALEMMESLKEFNLRRQTSMELHIGINSGLVIAGGIGSDDKQQYSVMGDAVNLAARLKEVSESGEIFVGEETFALTNTRFEFEVLPIQAIKGKKNLLQAYQLLRKIGSSPSHKARVFSKLVGRETEIAAFQRVINDLHGQKGGRLTLIGEAGLGKSRLIAEVRQQFSSHLLWVEGRALSFTRQSSYRSAIEMLKKLIGGNRDMTNAQIRSTLEAELSGIDVTAASEILPFLSQLLDLPLAKNELDLIKYLKPGELIKKTNVAFRKYLETKAQKQPVILVWEDMHWADSSTLLLLEELLSSCDQHPIMICLVFRPRKERGIWSLHEKARQGYADNYTTVELTPLNQSSSSLLLKSLLGTKAIPPKVAAQIFEKAEGNPFFMEELIRSMMDPGLSAPEKEGGGISPSVQPLKIPSTLHAVIAYRIDQLQAADKVVLQTAAVLGRMIPYDILEALVERRNESLLLTPVLERLETRDLLRTRPSGNTEVPELIFKHAITHDVTYESLLIADRRRIHNLAGLVIEEKQTASNEEDALTLARHFEIAQNGPKAIQYLKLAANNAQKLFSNEEAIDLYARAIEQGRSLLAKNDLSCDWRKELFFLYENLGDLYELSTQYESCRHVYGKALDFLAEEEWVQRARIEVKTGKSYQVSANFDQCLTHFDKAEALLQMSGNQQDQAWWHQCIETIKERSYVYYWMNRVADMQNLLAEQVVSIEQYGNYDQIASIHMMNVLMLLRKNKYLVGEETLASAHKMVTASSKGKDLRVKVMTSFLRGFAYLWSNQATPGIPYFKDALKMSNRIGDLVFTSRCLTYLAVSYRRLNQVDLAKDYALQAYDAAVVSKMPEYLGSAKANLAWVAFKNGEQQEVKNLAKEAIAFWNELPDVHSSVTMCWLACWPILAVLQTEGNIANALPYLEMMLQPEQKRVEDVLEQKIRLAVHLMKKTDLAKAEEVLGESIDLAKSLYYL